MKYTHFNKVWLIGWFLKIQLEDFFQTHLQHRSKKSHITVILILILISWGQMWIYSMEEGKIIKFVRDIPSVKF